MIVPEVGDAGQRQISSSNLRPPATADEGTQGWTRAFLERAGCTFSAEGEPLDIPSTPAVEALAKHPEYLGAVRLLLGSHVAVEALKDALGLPASNQAAPCVVRARPEPEP